MDNDAYFELARARGTALAPPPEAADGADPGAMAAVDAGVERTEALLADSAGVLVCNVNTADQTVVGGPTPAVEQPAPQ